MNCRRITLLLTLVLLSTRAAHAQSFGVEVFNNLMPASGGMAGASIASPQDLQSAINGNPATLTQYRGTQFGLGGAWIEPTYNLSVARTHRSALRRRRSMPNPMPRASPRRTLA